jgi:hypothetical protein
VDTRGSNSSDFALKSDPVGQDTSICKTLPVTSIESNSTVKASISTSGMDRESSNEPNFKKAKTAASAGAAGASQIRLLVVLELNCELTPDGQVNLVEAYNNGITTSQSNIISANPVQKCLHQLISYMEASGVRYAVITTHKHTYIVRLSVSTHGPTVEISLHFNRSVSMLHVYFYLSLLTGYC